MQAAIPNAHAERSARRKYCKVPMVYRLRSSRSRRSHVSINAKRRAKSSAKLLQSTNGLPFTYKVAQFEAECWLYITEQWLCLERNGGSHSPDTWLNRARNIHGGGLFQCKTAVRQRIYDRPAPQIATNTFTFTNIYYKSIQNRHS